MVTTSKKGVARRQLSRAHEEVSGMPERRGAESATGRVPVRALADGVVERRRATARNDASGSATLSGVLRRHLPSEPEEEQEPADLTAQEHYQLERRRRSDRLTGDLATLLAEAKAEYEAHINAPRPAGKGGRPRKKAAVVHDDDL